MQNNDLAVFQDFDDAIAGAVAALGGFKRVGCRLRPELDCKPDLAAQWLRDCLNPEKRERLNPHQVVLLLRLAKETGYHAAKHWLDAELGYEPGKPLNPVDERTRVQREFIDAVHESRRLADRLERLTQPPLQAVK